MDAQERSDVLKRLSDRFERLQTELAEIGKYVQFFDDRDALQERSLAWEVENSHVIAEHQVGRAFHDGMGYFNSPDVGPIGPRTPPRGMTIAQVIAAQFNRAKRDR